MKTINNSIVFILALALFVPTVSLAKGSSRSRVKDQPVTVGLSPAEIDTLLWMREEEKLARDVYLKLGKKWKQAIFNNIAASEQNHMDALLKKINTFGLEDPVLDGYGKFHSPVLQDLYDRLIAEGSESYIEALRVGVEIEDLDIVDLIKAVEESNNLSLQTTYASLLEGSKSHLRAFVGSLDQQGADYQIEYIEDDLLEAILGY